MKQFFHDLFYLPKHEMVTDRSLMKIIISSIVGISFCCLCLVSLSWAWFTDNSNAFTGNSISSATFYTEVCIEKVDGSGESQEVLSASLPSFGGYLMASLPALVSDASQEAFPITVLLENTYKLQNLPEGEYLVTIVPRGSATLFGGYIMLVADDGEPLYTEQLTIGEAFAFTLTSDGSVLEYEFFCAWGSLPDNLLAEDIIKNELDSDNASTPSSDELLDNSSNEVSSTDSSDDTGFEVVSESQEVLDEENSVSNQEAVVSSEPSGESSSDDSSVAETSTEQGE